MNETLEFEVFLRGKDLSKFLLQHTYSKFSGIFSIFVSLAALVVLCIKWNAFEIPQKGALVILALLFTVIQPYRIIQKGRKLALNPYFQEPMKYVITKDEIQVTQGDAKEGVDWKDIRKIKIKKDVIYVYVTTVNAYIFPKDAMGTAFDDLKQLIRK